MSESPKNGGGSNFFLLVGVLVMLVVCLGLYGSLRPQVTTGQEVAMVQPCGWPWCMQYDQTYSENNERNAHANEMNAHADVYKAQAEDITSQTTMEKTSQFTGGMALGIYGACFVFGLIVLGIIFLLRRLGAFG